MDTITQVTSGHHHAFDPDGTNKCFISPKIRDARWNFHLLEEKTLTVLSNGPVRTMLFHFNDCVNRCHLQSGEDKVLHVIDMPDQIYKSLLYPHIFSRRLWHMDQCSLTHIQPNTKKKKKNQNLNPIRINLSPPVENSVTNNHFYYCSLFYLLSLSAKQYEMSITHQHSVFSTVAHQYTVSYS